jgi:hypothetical protein
MVVVVVADVALIAASAGSLLITSFLNLKPISQVLLLLPPFRELLH